VGGGGGGGGGGVGGFVWGGEKKFGDLRTKGQNEGSKKRQELAGV